MATSAYEILAKKAIVFEKTSTYLLRFVIFILFFGEFDKHWPLSFPRHNCCHRLLTFNNGVAVARLRPFFRFIARSNQPAVKILVILVISSLQIPTSKCHIYWLQISSPQPAVEIFLVQHLVDWILDKTLWVVAVKAYKYQVLDIWMATKSSSSLETPSQGRDPK